MEYIDSVWQIGIIALVAGALIGVLVYRLFAPSVKEAGKIKTELDDAREELNSYKASVNQHFDKTSELVNDLTQNYVKVYQHLAAGAQILGDSKNFNNLLEQHQGRVSIAVDDEIDAPERLADDLVDDRAKSQAEPVATVDEHAEPFTDAGATDPVSAEPGTAKIEASGPAGDLGGSDEAREPVLNVDALEPAAGKAGQETRADEGSPVPEGEEKAEVRTTTH
ncbi:MAG: YhcB family protein [Gammaproteobacteria bacterium]|nr:YhcB family protein [Gammaproteobacteria bacterium]MDH3534146.1 YhcB family protein [Gammaproteobacteria bacterium]